LTRSTALHSLLKQTLITKPTLSAILYYISGHGFGHAVRAQQVIRALSALRPNLRLHIRTTAPQWIFHNPSAAIDYSHQAIDAGLVQADSLDMDLTATMAACRAIYANPQPLIDQELDFIATKEIELVVSDTPPLAFEIAAQASVPSVSITNFT